jgi:hypothetical protein
VRLQGSSAFAVSRLSGLEIESLCSGGAPTTSLHGCPEPPEHWLAFAAAATAGPATVDLAAMAAGFVPAGNAAAQAEADRQLRLLRELKAQLLAASNQAASSCGEAAVSMAGAAAAPPSPVAYSLAPALGAASRPGALGGVLGSYSADEEFVSPPCLALQGELPRTCACWLCTLACMNQVDCLFRLS